MRPTAALRDSPPPLSPRWPGPWRTSSRGRCGPHRRRMSSGACGGDLLFAEAVLGRGVPLRIYLPFEEPNFSRSRCASPGHSGNALPGRRRSIAGLRRPGRTGAAARGFGPLRAYEFLDAGRSASHRSSEGRFLCLWNGEGATAPGHPAHDGSGTTPAGRRRRLDRYPSVLLRRDHGPQPREHLDRARAPKRILALDGGGIRGVLTLEYLAVIEDELKKRSGRDDFHSVTISISSAGPPRDPSSPPPSHAGSRCASFRTSTAAWGPTSSRGPSGTGGSSRPSSRPSRCERPSSSSSAWTRPWTARASAPGSW